MVAYCRGGEVVAVAPRLVLGLQRGGGPGDTLIALPAGGWRDVLTGDLFDGGAVLVGDLWRRFPVALLARG